MMHKKKASLVPLINEEDLPSDDQQVVGSPMKSVNSASSPSLLLPGDSDTNSYFVSPQKLLTRRSQRIQTHLYVHFVYNFLLCRTWVGVAFRSRS